MIPFIKIKNYVNPYARFMILQEKLFELKRYYCYYFLNEFFIGNLTEQDLDEMWHLKFDPKYREGLKIVKEMKELSQKF